MAQQPDPYSLEGVKNREKPGFPWWTIFFALAALGLGVLIFSPYPEKIRRKAGLSGERSAGKQAKPEVIVEEKIVEKTVEKTVKVPPPYYQAKSGSQVAKTSKGYDFRTTFKEVPGKLASAERETEGSYEATLTVTVKRPQAAQTLEELKAVNPKLEKILPGLPDLLKKSKVSFFYDKLYANKAARLKSKAYQLDDLLTKHNYYDCQTMLEMEHATSKRKVFLFQADMDVVSDGSDGDRLATMPDKIVNSSYYQPFTSYGWQKTGSVENPMIAGWRKQVADEKAKATPSTSEIQRLERGIEDMKRRSFLIADYDPFIVIPVDMIADRESPFGPNVGDYVVVIHGENIFPAIIGDGGPTFKVGEGSLRLAKEVNPKASSYSRPVSDVSVTYLVFPRTSGKWVAPNYDDWRNECEKLLEEVGGLGEGYFLHQWENTLPEPAPEPAPVEEVVEPGS
ncbi:glycoside hydrolase family 75 protein [Verrucomicrobiaceae bacterium 227]